MNNFIKLQPKFVTQINNAKQSNRILHANIIEGDNSVIIDKAVNYLLASIFYPDDQSELSDADYETIINKNAANIISYDLNNDKFKKEDSILIQKQFSTTPLEGTKQVYIIKNIDKANIVVMNSLLKFLEEPTKDVYAILTTSNLEKVLDTIISRTMCYSLLSNDTSILKECYYPLYPKEEVDLVCEITKNEIRIKEILDDGILVEYKNALPKIFDAINKKISYPVFFELLNNRDKPALKIFFELFYLVLTNKKVQLLISLKPETIDALFNTPNYSKALDEVISAKVALDTNMNTALLIDKFSLRIEEYLQCK